MKLKDFPYKTSFSAEIKCLISDEADKFLSLASLNNLKFLIPQTFIDGASIDLLPISFNAAVVNRCNKNGDCIDTQTSIKICKNFIHRPVSIEHKPDDVCGHLINAGYTKFGSDEEMTEDQVTLLTDPFNIALAAYIYARNFPDLTEIIEESGDPDSFKYKMVSASWELLFSQARIVKGSKNLSEASIIDNLDEIKKLEPFLQVNGGTGKDKEGNSIYRLISGDVYAGGIGVVRYPAAEVKGLYIPGITDKNNDNSEKSEANEINLKNIKNNEEIISNLTIFNVNQIEHMKLSTIEDVKALTDETLKTVTAANLTEVLSDGIAKISAQVIAERQAKEKAEAAVLKAAEDFEKIKNEFENIKSVQAAKDSENTFNNRMISLDEVYDLDAPHRKIIAKQIKDLDEIDFTVWAADFEILAKDKKKVKGDIGDDEAEAKKVQAAKDAKDKEDKDKKAAKDKDDMNDKDKKDSKASDARALLDAIKLTQASVIPNTISGEQSLIEKYRGAFNKETVTVKNRR